MLAVDLFIEADGELVDLRPDEFGGFDEKSAIFTHSSERESQIRRARWLGFRVDEERTLALKVIRCDGGWRPPLPGALLRGRRRGRWVFWGGVPRAALSESLSPGLIYVALSGQFTKPG